ncbi:MAG: hypothetical protein Q7U51_11655 [Methanoregula sp.]|nr:hypothetical protein [Methanoregula sp.]
MSIINLIIIWLSGIDPDALNVIITFNFFLTIIFLSDFLYRFITDISQIRNALHEQNRQRLDLIEQQLKRRFPEGT